MKKFFYMAVAAIAALSSCSGDDAIFGEDGKQNGEDVTTFTATIESDAATRTSYNSTSKKAEWIATTDKINVGGAEYTAQQTGATTTFSGSGATKGSDEKYHAYYPSSMVSGSTITLPASYAYDGKFNMPMYAESETTSLEFKNICGVLAITVPSTQMTSVKSITVTSDKQLNGELSSISANGVPAFKTEGVTLTDAMKKVKLTFASPVVIASGSSKTLYVPVPAGTHKPLRIIVTNGSVSKVMETKKEGGVSVERSKIYSITFAHNDNNLLTSVFSVSATKTVQFTKGNLQATYNGSTYAWGFAANQWVYVGNAAGNTAITSDGKNTDGKVVDLFGWSTDATNNNWGIHTKTENTDGYTTGNFKDWGENFPGKYYSTLSKDELTYLLKTRTVNGGTGEGKSYKKTELTLSGNTTKKLGLLIVPDDYTGTLSNSTSWSEWQKMESAGVVFLPSAGIRTGSSVVGAGNSTGSNYWSSTAKSTASAYALDFYYNDPVNYYALYYGLSVRLVSVASE